MTSTELSHLIGRVLADDADLDIRALFPDERHDVIHQMYRSRNVSVVTHLARENERCRLLDIGAGCEIVEIDTCLLYTSRCV